MARMPSSTDPLPGKKVGILRMRRWPMIMVQKRPVAPDRCGPTSAATSAARMAQEVDAPFAYRAVIAPNRWNDCRDAGIAAWASMGRRSSVLSRSDATRSVATRIRARGQRCLSCRGFVAGAPQPLRGRATFHMDVLLATLLPAPAAQTGQRGQLIALAPLAPRAGRDAASRFGSWRTGRMPLFQ